MINVLPISPAGKGSLERQDGLHWLLVRTRFAHWEFMDKHHCNNHGSPGPSRTVRLVLFCILGDLVHSTSLQGNLEIKKESRPQLLHRSMLAPFFPIFEGLC